MNRSEVRLNPCNVLLIDNFDSFAFNLVDEFRKLGGQVAVWRNSISAEDALSEALKLATPRLIVLSPGPGRPEEAGCCEPLIRLAKGKIPIFGVCLGLQAMVSGLGGEVGAAEAIVHGKSDWIEHTEEGIFSGLPSPLQVGRYHSLAAVRLPEGFRVTARRGQTIMAIAHNTKPLAAVQFHPESILTPRGSALIARVAAWAIEGQTGPHSSIFAA